MSKTSITCNNCGITFEKRTADYNKERRKNPECNFFCTQSCHSKVNVGHLKGLCSFADRPELLRKALAAAAKANTRYNGRDKVFATIIRKCKQRKKEFDLTIEFLGELWDRQGGECALSNIPLDLDSTSFVTMPSIDRIDSKKGYVVGNVQFVSCSINLAKSSMGDDRVHELLRLVCQHYKK